MEQERERWDSRTAFVMAAIGSAVGLGNVWRFPAVCYANGGGAFFIPYLIALLTAGIPLLILEYGIGQMMQGSAPAALRKINKHTEWVGWFALIVGTTIAFYYAVIMAYAMEYLVYSFQGFFTGGQMPWSTPSKGWKGGAYEGEFFSSVVLRDAKKAEELWQYVWPLVIGLAVTWGAVFLIIFRGVRRVGKIVMWTVPLPLVVLGILIVRGFTLDGAAEGIIFYLTPDFEALKDPATWLAAYGQIFFSLSIGFGIMIAYASYRPRESDVTNNAFITAFANCATSFFAGFAVFSVIGFLAKSQGKAVGEVMAGGPGLVFITYPTAISEMGDLGALWPPVVGILFFLMLLALGIDSLFSIVEGVVAGLHDRFPSVTKGKVTAGFCLLGFCVGTLLFANRAGILWLDIFDHWASDYGLAIVGLLQCVIVGYFFDMNKLRDYINKVSEIKLWGWWELCVRVITPTILVFLLATNFLKELTREKMFGATGTAFDQYLFIAPLAFACFFVLAFALARMWTYLGLVGFGVVVFLLTWIPLRNDPRGFGAAMFSGIAAAILFGGLFVCLRIAKRGKIEAEAEPMGEAEESG